uniref:Uncharacterized protein n=1 Tax=Octopus bimaculoides TaxID=37653 RepID=A0A0L8HHP4_OCTBM
MFSKFAKLYLFPLHIFCLNMGNKHRFETLCTLNYLENHFKTGFVEFYLGSSLPDGIFTCHQFAFLSKYFTQHLWLMRHC